DRARAGSAITRAGLRLLGPAARAVRPFVREVGMLKVYGRKSSFNLQKVMWLVGELALPHEHIQLGGSFGGLDDSAFLAMNPHGRVPTIDDGGTVVWESHAILRYLAARHGGQDWWSPNPVQR